MSDCAQCHSYALENSALVEELSALITLTRKQALSEQALRRELKQLRRADPLALDIMGVLRLWRALCVASSSRNRVSIDLDGDRAKVVRAALKSKTTGDRKERRRMCMDAIRGLALRPYVVNAQRKAAGQPQQRYCKVDHALSDEGRIEEHAGYYRMAQAQPLEWKNAAWMAAIDTESRWRDLYLAEVYRVCRANRQGRPHLFVVPDVAEAA